MLDSNAESAMRASFVNDSIHLRERAAEMRVSSKELKDNNTAAVIMRLADLCDRLADRAEEQLRSGGSKNAVNRTREHLEGHGLTKLAVLGRC
jgi:hypothetical protein